MFNKCIQNIVFLSHIVIYTLVAVHDRHTLMCWSFVANVYLINIFQLIFVFYNKINVINDSLLYKNKSIPRFSNSNSVASNSKIQKIQN